MIGKEMDCWEQMDLRELDSREIDKKYGLNAMRENQSLNCIRAGPRQARPVTAAKPTALEC